MPQLYRAQATLRHASGLPRDNVTNTFWMLAPGDAHDPVLAESVAEKVRDFYVETADGSNAPVMEYLNNSLAQTQHTVKVTPISIATGLDERGLGFPPLHTEVFDFVGWTPEVSGLPNEVAVCLSFKNMESGGVPPARRRGRVFVGPIAGPYVVASGGAWRPHGQMTADILRSGENLVADAVAIGMELVVYSRPFEGRAEVPRPGNPRGPLPALPARAGATYPVTDLWIDNAFDTIRKRGERPTSRLTATV